MNIESDRLAPNNVVELITDLNAHIHDELKKIEDGIRVQDIDVSAPANSAEGRLGFSMEPLDYHGNDTSNHW